MKRPIATIAAATAITVALPLVMVSEGLRTDAYLDPVGIPTICFGETLGVELGQSKSKAECTQMLAPRLEGFLKQMRSCTKGDMPVKTEAAFLSFTYNLGPGIYCRNIALKRWNMGKKVQACEAMMLYTKAGRPLRVLPGLVTRRLEERDLCLDGLRGT